MATFRDKKEPTLVTDGQFFVRYIGNIYFTTALNKTFQFTINQASITLTANTSKTMSGGSKHFTGYTPFMFDEFYDCAGCYITEAQLEWDVKDLDGAEIDRVEKMEHIKNFKMKLDTSNTDFAVPVWRIDFDYGNY